MRRSVAILVGVTLLIPLWTTAQEAREVPPHGRNIDYQVDFLGEYLDMKDFQQPMRLKDVLGLLYEKFASQGKELPILVNTTAFSNENPNAKEEVYDTQVQFPPYPRKMTLATALRFALSNVETGNATYLIRKNHIEVTTLKQASLPVLLRQPVVGRFHKVLVSEIIEQLAEEGAVSINWDPKTNEQASRPVSATFRNDTSLEEAVRVLTEMVGLKVVRFQSGLYITPPENVAALEKERKQREAEAEQEILREKKKESAP